MRSLRIGVNALYLIPGGVGGTEIYLRCLLAALARIDPVNRYFVFTNRETGPDLVPDAENFICVPQPVAATSRPARILWEQIALPIEVARRHLDVLFNPGFTAPLFCGCPMVTVFHDLQHKRHPEYFRWFELPFWRIFLFAAAYRSARVLAVSEATAADLRAVYRLPAERHHGGPSRRRFRNFSASAQARRPALYPLRFDAPSSQEPGPAVARVCDLPSRAAGIPAGAGRHARLPCGRTGDACATRWDWRTPSSSPAGYPRERLYELYAGASAFLYPSDLRGLRHAGAGGAGSGVAHRLLAHRADGRSGRRGGVALRPGGHGGDGRSDAPARPPTKCARGCRRRARCARRNSPGKPPRGKLWTRFAP